MRAISKLCASGGAPVNQALSFARYQSRFCRSDFARGSILLIRATPSRAAPPYSKRSASSGMRQAPFRQDVSNGVMRAAPIFCTALCQRPRQASGFGLCLSPINSARRLNRMVNHIGSCAGWLKKNPHLPLLQVRVLIGGHCQTVLDRYVAWEHAVAILARP